ncbi:hypothetical protein R3P38DRAFT_412717 [Favolaschia claudopus]|uniref:Secreted protein n=1 Tax=Favolaschia claudopus TaxID=2862362 RepID=A0AAV9ZHM8_9AGAR
MVLGALLILILVPPPPCSSTLLPLPTCLPFTLYLPPLESYRFSPHPIISSLSFPLDTSTGAFSPTCSSHPSLTCFTEASTLAVSADPVVTDRPLSSRPPILLHSPPTLRSGVRR